MSDRDQGNEDAGWGVIGFVSWAELHRDVATFASRFHGKVDLVAGVPRSGVLIANMIALHLNVPCATVIAGGLSFWGSGPRMSRPRKGGKILIIDDSALSGSSLAKVLACPPGTQFAGAEVGVLYVSEKIARDWESKPDHSFLRVIQSPRLFAWNWAHAAQTRNVAFDFDGVICRDPTVREDDEAGYVKAITSAAPLYVPTWPVGGIVTHRLERRRAVTAAWMQRHGVVVKPGGLVMHPAATCVERRARREQDGTWKGKIYKARGWLLFVESDPKQAARIHAVSGKPVYCPATDQIWRSR